MTISRLNVLFFCLIFLSNCAQESESNAPKSKPNNAELKDRIQHSFSLSDYLTTNGLLDAYVDSIYASLNETDVIAQLIMPAAGKYGQSKETINGLINDHLIGGVLMLNGTKEEFSKWIKEFNQSNIKHGNLPFLYSADAKMANFHAIFV